MFTARKIEAKDTWLDISGIKIYTISATDSSVEHSLFTDRLEHVKSTKNIEWQQTPAFVIFHHGASCHYLVLCWWGNDNELFTSVSVRTNNGWIEDSNQYSFCLYDMEVMWNERNIYIKTIDCEEPCLKKYRETR